MADITARLPLPAAATPVICAHPDLRRLLLRMYGRGLDFLLLTIKGRLSF